MAIRPRNHTAALVELVADMPELIEALEAGIAKVVTEMAKLEEAGLIYATEHWRKDSKGNPKYLYLLYPQKNGEARRRDYVGCVAKEIAAARAGVVRAQEFDKLAGSYSALVTRANNIAEALNDARLYLIR